MGYRSDVFIALEFAASESCDNWIVAAKLRSDPAMWRDMFGHAQRSEDGRVVIVQFDDVKWYPDFDDVKFMYDTLNWTHDHWDMGWRVVRIGEELDDIEDEYNPPRDDVEMTDNLWEILEVERTVDYGTKLTRTLDDVAEAT